MALYGLSVSVWALKEQPHCDLPPLLEGVRGAC